MPRLFKGTKEILSLAGGTKNVKALYAGNRLVWGKANGQLKDFLFLTYFDNFDAATLTDTPVVGSPVVYTNSLHPTVSSMSSSIGTTSALSYYVSFDTTYNVNVFPLLENNRVYTIDFLMEFATNNAFFAYLSPICDIAAYDRSYSGGMTGFWLQSTTPVVYRKDGIQTIDRWSNWTGYGVQNRAKNKVHFAFVFDFINSQVKLYLDGILCFILTCSYSRYTEKPNAFFGSYNRPSMVTQLSLREGDFSDGDTFPVPTEPYYKRT